EHQSAVRGRKCPELLRVRRGEALRGVDQARVQRPSRRGRHVARALGHPLVGGLVPLERAARVEQPVEQPLLAGEHVGVQPAAAQLAGELLGLARQLVEAAEHVLAAAENVVHAAQLLRDLALPPGQFLELLAHDLWSQIERDERARLTVQRALLPRQLGELLHGLLHPGARLRLRDLLPVREQRQRQPVQRLHGLRRLLRRDPLRTVLALQRVQRLLHAQVRPAQRRPDVAIDHRGALRRLRQVPAQRLEPLLKRGLLRPHRLHLGLARLPALLLGLLHALRERVLPLRERERVLRRPLDRLLRFLLPRLRHPLARGLERLRGLLRLLRRLLAALPGLLALPLARLLRRLLHALLRLLHLLRGLARLLRSLRFAHLLELLLQLLELLLERLRLLRQRLLLLRPLRRLLRRELLAGLSGLGALPLHRLGERFLLPRQLLRLVRQRIHLLLRGGAPQQLEALVELLAELLLLLRELLECLLHLLRVELVQRLPQLCELLLQVGRQHLVVELPQLLEPFPELRVLEAGRLHRPLELGDALAQLLDLRQHLLLPVQELLRLLRLAVLEVAALA